MAASASSSLEVQEFDVPFLSQPVSRKNLLVVARLAERAERYDEMAAAMKLLASSASDLTSTERHLLSCAYKNVIYSRRSAWRSLKESKIVNRAGKKNEWQEVDALINSYLTTVEKELRDYCM